MKTFLEYIQKKQIIDNKYKNPYWKNWGWRKEKIPNYEHEAFTKFIKERYGNLLPDSYINLLKDYYLDYLNVTYPTRKTNNKDAEHEITYIQDHKDEYDKNYKPSFGQGFVDFIYKNCIE